MAPFKLFGEWQGPFHVALVLLSNQSVEPGAAETSVILDLFSKSASYGELTV
jgi:hypothetical protein